MRAAMDEPPKQMPDFSGLPEEARQLVFVIVDMLEEQLHMRDSAIQVVQQIPGWQEKYQAAFDNPLRAEHTRQLLVPLRKLLEAMFRGEANEKVLDDIHAIMSRLPS
jgi:hypothetical protein